MTTNIYVKSFGCSANFADGETMCGLLKEADFNIVDNVEDAFIVILNICTVKGDDNALKEIRQVRESNEYKKIIVSGCIPKHAVEDIKKIDANIALINTHNIRKIVSVVEELLNDNPITILTSNKKPKINLPKLRKNPFEDDLMALQRLGKRGVTNVY